jgi:hypothetical protein
MSFFQGIPRQELDDRLLRQPPLFCEFPVMSTGACTASEAETSYVELRF